MPRAMLDALALLAAVWRLSHMLVKEQGAGDMFETLRFYISKSPLQGVEACLYCMSVWVGGVLLALSPLRVGQWLIRALALSAGAILIEEMRQWQQR